MNINRMATHLNDGHQYIYDRDNNRLSYTFSPELHNNASDLFKSNRILTELLSWHKDFNVDIQAIRTRFSIMSTTYPNEATVEQLIDIFKIKTSHISYSDIEKEIDYVILRYKLNQDWFLSIISAITTNTLLVPNSVSLFINVPETEPVSGNDSKTLKSLFNSPEMQRAHNAQRLLSFPGIYFTQYTSIDKLKKWINENKKVIRLIQKQLPKNEIHKNEINSLFWGKACWFYMSNGANTWTEIENRIAKDCEKIIEDEGETNNEDIVYTPTSIELQKYYRRFIDSLKKLNPSDT